MLGKPKRDNPEAVEALKKMPSLKKILQDTNVVVKRPVVVNSRGFMYLSRFSKEDGSVSTKAKEKVQRSVADDDLDNEISSHVDQEVFMQESGTINSSANNEKKRRYALSLATLAAKPDKRSTIVNEGAVSVLIELANMHDKAVQVRVASAFSSLSMEQTLRQKVLDDGALTAMVTLATTSNIREVKLDCARAICNLCCEDGYEFKMVKEGVPFMVTHIAATVPESFEVCLKILMNITCVPDKFARIEDVTEALMYFVNINTPLSYEQELLILASFRNLAGLRSNQLRLVEDGCLKVVDRFYQSTHPDLRQMACEILQNLTMDQRTRMKLLDLNILSILLQMFYDKDEEVRKLCVTSFLYLSDDDSFRHKIVHGAALKQILSFMLHKEQSISMGQLLAKLMRTICGDRSMAPKVVEDGGGKALIKLIRSEDRLIQQFCAESLCGLFQTQEILDLLVEQGASYEMTNLALHTTDPFISEWCAFGLYQLSMGCSADTMQESFLRCIIHLCELAASTNVTKMFCSAAFAHATRFKSIDCSGAIPLLVEMLKGESNQTIKKYCASALFNLADSTENCYKMLDSEALLPVVELTQNEFTQGASDPKVICAGIISRLSLHPQYYDQFAAGNVLKVLLELSCVDHRLTQRRVVIALSNLSQSVELRSKLIDLNPIPYIISLASERDEYLRRGCISIVCNMSYEQGSERAIIAANIMPTLMITSLITSDQLASKLICVKALVNLMADRTLYKSMVKDGVIWGLSKLAQLDDPEMLTLCAKALCCLSREFSREILSSSVAVRTVLRLIAVPDPAIMTIGSRILTNVLLHTGPKDEDFRKLVVENMYPLGMSEIKEVNELCVVCLCLASQSEGCRTGIVSSGMLQNIDSRTIFADLGVSYAYITMFGNIANNPTMRSRVLDDHLIERFERICQSKQYNLCLAVAKALYCVSCSTENIPKLVNQMIVPFVKSLTELDFEGSNNNYELRKHLIATMYNLSTHTDVQNLLVSHGFAETMHALWNEAEKDPVLMKLGYFSFCHLACGKTNSTRMVQDGCTRIFNVICKNPPRRDGPATSTNASNAYRLLFNADVHYRCSAALRNLVTVVGNQKSMVDEGVLDTIIYLADYCSTDRFGRTNPSSPTFGNLRGIRRNCAVALNSMTYNKEVRDKLVESEAINIILENVDKDGSDMHVSQGLMRELEAESWDNGARGRAKDGRSKYISPAPLFTEYLGGASNVELDIELKDETLDKFYVQVQMDEPVIGSSSGESGNAAGATAGHGSPDSQSQGGAGGVVNSFSNDSGDAPALAASATGSADEDGQQHNDQMLSITALTPYEEGQGTLVLTSHKYQKQECDAGIETITLFRIENMDENASYNSDEADSNTPINTNTNQTDNNAANTTTTESADAAGATATDGSVASGNSSQFDPFPLDTRRSAQTQDTTTASSKNNGKNSKSVSVSVMDSADANDVLTPSPTSAGGGLQKRVLPNLFMQVSLTPRGNDDDGLSVLDKMIQKSSSDKLKTVELPRLNTRQRERKEKFQNSIKRQQQKGADEEALSNLVGMIKDAKDKGGALDGVLQKWREISQY